MSNLEIKHKPKLQQPPLFLYRSQSHKNRYLRQHVGLTGLGSDIFASSIVKLREVHELFANSFPEGAVKVWEPAKYLDYGDTITASNRYFTPIQDAPNEVSVPFRYMVDPAGNLRDMMGDTLMHGADNDVVYYGHKVTAEGKSM